MGVLRQNPGWVQALGAERHRVRQQSRPGAESFLALHWSVSSFVTTYYSQYNLMMNVRQKVQQWSPRTVARSLLLTATVPIVPILRNDYW